MCEYCHQTICPGGCPNAVEKVAFECDLCGEDIMVGDEYYEMPNLERWCEECFNFIRADVAEEEE